MTNTLHCCKLASIEPALQNAPFPGPLGEKILQCVSQKAWDMWCAEEIKYINEYRLDLTDESTRQKLEIHMIEFLNISLD